MTPFFTNKVLIDKNITLNTTMFPLELGLLEKIFKEIIPCGTESYYKWQKFQTLTKKEKILLKKLVLGKTNFQISEELYISKHTVVTHRKNIYKKLEVKNITELIQFSMLLNVL